MLIFVANKNLIIGSKNILKQKITYPRIISEIPKLIEESKFSEILSGLNVSTSSKPIRILWTRWRSGSTLVSDLLVRAAKKTYSFYEPLLKFGHIIHGRESEKIQSIVQILKEAFICDLNNKYFKSYFKLKLLKIKFNSIIEYETKKKMRVSFMTKYCNKADSITTKVYSSGV